MSYAPVPAAGGNGHRVALLGIGLLGAALFALVQAGVVAPPDLEGALTDLSDTLGAWTYALVGGLAFLETGAFVGLIAPGETAVVLGGVVAAEGGVDLPLMLLITWSAAALGDLASFWLGRRLGRRFLIDHGPRIGVTAPRLERVEDFFDRHGGKAILIGRFIGLVRAVAPFLAGSSGHAPARLPPVVPAGHRGVGDDLHARRLRLPRFLHDGRLASHPRGLRARDRCRGRVRVAFAPPLARRVVCSKPVSNRPGFRAAYCRVPKPGALPCLKRIPVGNKPFGPARS